LRARSLGGAEFVPGVLCGEGSLLRPAARDRLAEGVVRLAAADDGGGASDHRNRLVPLRHHAEPAVARGAPPVHARTGPHRAAGDDRGAIRAEHAARYLTVSTMSSGCARP